MEQEKAPAADTTDPAFAALVAAIDRLDDLGLADKQGRLLVEPASTFQWT
jgi:hypothetical protein